MRLTRLMGLMAALIVLAGCGRPAMEYDSFPTDMSHWEILLDEVDGRRVVGGTAAGVLAALNRYGWDVVCVAGNDVVVRRKARGNNEVGSFKVQYRKD